MRKKNYFFAILGIVIIIALLGILFFAVSNITVRNTETMQAHQLSIKNIPDTSLKRLADKKIYFAHMSVGYEIVKGIEQLVEEYPELSLNVVETNDSAAFSVGIFAHSKIGKNRNPNLKIKEFFDILESGLDNKADLVILKLCFVDVERDTDIDALFKNYVKRVDEIKKGAPDLKILHSTVPIRVKPGDFKGKINQLLVRDHNIKRNKYNDMLRAHFPEDELFDLALYESLNDKGERMAYSVFGKKVYIMNPDYTYDGGHLNEKGARLIGEKLIVKMVGQFEN